MSISPGRCISSPRAARRLATQQSTEAHSGLVAAAGAGAESLHSATDAVMMRRIETTGVRPKRDSTEEMAATIIQQATITTQTGSCNYQGSCSSHKEIRSISIDHPTCVVDVYGNLFRQEMIYTGHHPRLHLCRQRQPHQSLHQQPGAFVSASWWALPPRDTCTWTSRRKCG